MNENIKHQTFADVDLSDKFFDTLKRDYPEFENWFNTHLERDAYVLYNSSSEIQGFLHLKNEYNVVDDVRPIIKADKILKVATFKVDAHGTKLGEQFIKIIMDYAISELMDVCYVTIFEKHEHLIRLVEKYGFDFYGIKEKNGKRENVYVKDMRKWYNDLDKDYPRINLEGKRKYMLSIYPAYHSIMFPDSILTTENKNIIKDVSYTNSIYKIYVCSMKDVDTLKQGDILVLYRTADFGKSAEYSSVATSVCVVESVKKQNEFNSFEEFYEYACKYSVFEKADLKKWYDKGSCVAIKMTYNMALKKRIVRHDLIEDIGIDRDAYWGFLRLSDEQFWGIVENGKINYNIFK